MDEGTVREIITSDEAAPPYEELESGLRINQAHNHSEAIVTGNAHHFHLPRRTQYAPFYR